ncbi:MAG: hypothetical protein MUF87_21400 [Anaerolineae bacterium]|jgi:hypothetical protein|nr:hypothetical protein [Anaerolineae bacterium]
MTRSQPEWIKAADLREQVRQLLGYSSEQMGHAQWIGHILNRLQLIDSHRRKAYAGGQLYQLECEAVIDIMRRYEVQPIQTL